jgi:integrase
MEVFVMASVRYKSSTKRLFLDFQYRGQRCREFTALNDSPANRKKLETLLKHIEAEILLGTFNYAAFFPNSNKAAAMANVKAKKETTASNCPTFHDFYLTWWNENEVRWRKSTILTLQARIEKYLLPAFVDKPLNSITRPEILALRADICRSTGKKGNISNVTVNKIMQSLRQILDEGALRFSYTSPFVGIKTLKKARTDVHPFTIDEVKLILNTVRKDFRSYFTVRFFTGMRTNEIDGLQWKFVDFKNKQIIIREGLVRGEMTNLKTDGSAREIDMTTLVYDALKQQEKRTKGMRYVFCSPEGYTLSHTNVTKRVWAPLLKLLGLEYRRPYEMRHTAATLWLASGEAPEYIARQMGHTTTEMLFRVYSRYVPNLTRQDGSAFENLINSQVNVSNTQDETN